MLDRQDIRDLIEGTLTDIDEFSMPVNVRNVAKKLGITVLVSEMEDCDAVVAKGLVNKVEFGGQEYDKLIVLNKNLVLTENNTVNINKFNYMLAFELARFILKDGEENYYYQESYNELNPNGLANKCACELLVPYRLLQEFVDSIVDYDVDKESLALIVENKFQVVENVAQTAVEASGLFAKEK